MREIQNGMCISPRKIGCVPRLAKILLGNSEEKGDPLQIYLITNSSKIRISWSILMTCASNWTVWRKLVDADDDKHYNLENVVDKKHPACYQLAIGGPRGGNIKIKYVGYTGNLTERMTSYGNHGSHIAKHIDSAIEEGDSIFYRYKKCNTENQAWECEQRQLSRLKKRMKFMWNKVGSQ